MAAEIKIFTKRDKNFHSNTLINSRHEYSLIEKKIIYCIINQIDANMDVQKDLFENMYFSFPVSILGDDFQYKNLKEALKKLSTRNITGGDDKKQHFFSITPIPKAEIKNGRINVSLYAEAVPYFVDLKKMGYTSYRLDVALSLTSVYSQRMFELLSRFRDTGKWYDVEIENLKYMLGIDKEKSYTRLNNLINRVIEPARVELKEKTDLEFVYTLQKTGKKNTHISFDIYTKDLIKYIGEIEKKENARATLEYLADASSGAQMVYLISALKTYNFTEEQERLIQNRRPLTLKFLEIHALIQSGSIKVETTPTRLMAWHLRQLGWK